MKTTFNKKFVAVMVACMMLGAIFVPTVVLAEKTYKIAWSHYTGWESWGVIASNGIMDKWAKKYGVKIQIDYINDYIESINLYTNGEYDGVTVTNMDALSIPAASGVDTTALIVGDFSNGNDVVIAKNASALCDLKNREIMLVELSVSHYLLVRLLESKCGMTERDVKIVNTSDADIAAAFESNSNGAIVTWNPIAMVAKNVPGAKALGNSSQTPGEIIDMMAVLTSTPDNVKKALVGAWYEGMKIMSSRSKDSRKMIADMANQSGATVPEFRAQIKTTAMFYDGAGAANFVKSDDLKKTMDYVRTFLFDHGLLGDGAQSKDAVGIAFPDGSVMGNKNNVKLRFNSTYMQAADEGKL